MQILSHIAQLILLIPPEDPLSQFYSLNAIIEDLGVKFYCKATTIGSSVWIFVASDILEQIHFVEIFNFST